MFVELKFKRHSGFVFDPKKAALIVIDLQGYFTNSGSHAYVPGSAKIIDNVNAIVSGFYALGRPVIFTRHIDIDKNGLMCKWWRGLIDKNDPLNKLDPRLNARHGKTIIKHSYDAFLKTNLDKILKRKKITEVVITGVVTHLCCETTARSAFTRGFLPYFVTDATGAHTKAHHNASIFNLARGFAIPVKTKDLLKCLPKRSS